MSASEGSMVQQEQICGTRQLLLGAQSPHSMPVGSFNLRPLPDYLLTQCAFIARQFQVHLRDASFGLTSSERNSVCTQRPLQGELMQKREILRK